LDLPGAVDVDGGYAYVTDGSLHVISVSDHWNPVLAGLYEPTGSVRGVAVSGNYAYVGRYISEYEKGLQVLSITDPTDPVEVGYISIPTGAGDPTAIGRYVGVIGSSYFRLISTTDPMNPVELGYYLIDGYPRGLDLNKSYAYVANESRGVIVLEYYDAPTTIGGDGGNGHELPGSFSLSQNYPNPFNPSTTITFDLPGEADNRQHVNLTIYDLRGRRVRELINTDLETGSHKIHWDGRNDQGESVPSGIYIYRLKAGGETITRKMTVCT
jgi:hypothetical protein